jgi:copper chaperone CopZ
MHYYFHVLPGRIEVQASDLKKNKLRAVSVRRCLRTVEGIQSVTLNLTRGSVLIHFDRGGANSRRILNQIAKEGFGTESGF